GSGSDCGTLFVFRNKDYGKLQNRHFGLPIVVRGRLRCGPLKLFGHDICHADSVMNGTGASAATPR
ncbi:MAG: hypothetical protein WCC37_16115, partial [Candidatus Sulfotelmatobacter sp.]